jgi:hypothetical protein
MPNFVIKAFDRDYNEIPFAIDEGDFTMEIPDDCILRKKVQQEIKVDLQTGVKNPGKLILPDWETVTKDLHDSDWGWIDSQSYWSGVRDLYERLK